MQTLNHSLSTMNSYVSQISTNTFSAGHKARADVQHILADEGFRNIGLNGAEGSDKLTAVMSNFFGLIKASLLVRKGDTLLLQYPHPGFSLMCRVAQKRGAKVVALIHDLRSFRGSNLSVEKEMKRLSRASHIIASNPTMMQILKTHLPQMSLSSLGLWDYLSDSAPVASRVRNRLPRVAYAGQLTQKNSFLWRWGDVVDGYFVDIYGLGFRMDQVAHPEWFVDHGFVDSDRLISGMTGDFGLVWDGESLDSCKDGAGSYLAINTPHKLSLYLRAGLPIIIWSGAALAPLVKEMGIGVTINSLADLGTAITAITPTEYVRLKGNVDRLSESLARGLSFRHALHQALQS